MNIKTNVLGMFCCIASMSYAQQQTDSTNVEQLEEVVITDSKFRLKRENSGKVITKITQEELQNLQGKSVAEIINTTAGIEINGTKSNAGQNLSYFIRGGRNRQVLVLIDGIAVTDPSQIANDYDLRLLDVNQVDSIEILKGASSTLYGSGAATAVINIKLKEAAAKPFAITAKSTLGTSKTQEDSNYYVKNFNNNFSINGTLDNFTYLASIGNQFTDGFSAVANGTERDVFSAVNGNLKLGYLFSEAFKMHFYGSFDKFKADFDDGFTFMDADNQSDSDQYRVGISPEYNYKNGSIILNAAYSNMKRDIYSSFPSQFNSESLVADLYNRYNFSDSFYTILGVNVQDNNMESYAIPFGSSMLEQSINPDDAKFSIVDPYANVVYISEFGLNVNAGARLNNHSEYGSHLVYSINPSYTKNFNFGYLKGLASYSTAYITPSLYQLFEPTYGNADLKPEENSTLEVGAEVFFNNRGNISVVYFNRKEENFIDFVDLGGFVYQYKNIEESFTASGFEIIANYEIIKNLRLQANGTITKVDQDLNLRIPEFKLNTQLNYQVSPSTFLSLGYQYNDDRRDSVYNSTTFMNEDVFLDSYGLLDFYVSHKVLKGKMTIFANMTNILNEDYLELFGYSTKGRNVNIGFNLSL